MKRIISTIIQEMLIKNFIILNRYFFIFLNDNLNLSTTVRSNDIFLRSHPFANSHTYYKHTSRGFTLLAGLRCALVSTRLVFMSPIRAHNTHTHLTRVEVFAQATGFLSWIFFALVVRRRSEKIAYIAIWMRIENLPGSTTAICCGIIIVLILAFMQLVP